AISHRQLRAGAVRSSRPLRRINVGPRQAWSPGRTASRGDAAVVFRDLLVHLDAGSGAEARLALALEAARAFTAHLTALCLIGEPAAPLIELPPETLYRERLEAAADRLLAAAAAKADRA